MLILDRRPPFLYEAVCTAASKDVVATVQSLLLLLSSSVHKKRTKSGNTDHNVSLCVAIGAVWRCTEADRDGSAGRGMWGYGLNRAGAG